MLHFELTMYTRIVNLRPGRRYTNVSFALRVRDSSIFLASPDGVLQGAAYALSEANTAVGVHVGQGFIRRLFVLAKSILPSGTFSASNDIRSLLYTMLVEL